MSLPGGPELLIILVVVLLVFGPAKVPEFARGVGKAVRELRRLTTDFQREINLTDALEEADRAAPPARPVAPPPAASGAGSSADPAAPAGQADPADTSAPDRKAHE